jgi:hypothetical protein
MYRIVRAPLAALLAIPAVALAAAAPASAAPSDAAATLSAASIVHPGESIQAAIDAAAAGATVTVASGTYAESLTITKPITLVGRGSVVISPPATAPDNACTQDPDADGRFPGVCVVGQLTDVTEEAPSVAVPVTDVSIGGLDVRGFTAAAVEIYGAEHVTLDRITATGNLGGGVFAAEATDVRISSLTAARNGARGIDIHHSVTGFAIMHSLITDNHGEGLFVGDSSDGLVAHDTIGGNCTGILLIDLALPDDTGVSGIRVSHNDVTANNARCDADDEGQPAESGSGIVMVGVRNSAVTHNLVRGNSAPEPVDVSFGGVALLDAGALTGGSAPSGNLIAHNVITGNAPFDLLYDGSGADNTVRGNVCAVSMVSGACTPAD